MASKQKKVTLGHLGVLFAAKKKSVVKVTSSTNLVGPDTSKDKKGKNKGKKKGNNVTSESSTEITQDQPEKPLYIWNEEIANLSIKDNAWKKKISILHRVRQPMKKDKYTVRKKIQENKKPILIAVSADDDVPVKPFVKTNNPGISVGDNGRIIPHSILGTEEEYLAQAMESGHVVVGDVEEEFPYVERKSKIPQSIYFRHFNEGKVLNSYDELVDERKNLKRRLAAKMERPEEDLIMGDCYEQSEPAGGRIQFSGNKNYWKIEKNDPRFVGFWKQQIPLGDEMRGIHLAVLKTEQGFPPPRELDGLSQCVKQERDATISEVTIPKVYSIPDTTELYVKGTNGLNKEKDTVEAAVRAAPMLRSVRPSKDELYWRNRLYVKPNGSWVGSKTQLKRTAFGPHLDNDNINNDMPVVLLTGDASTNGPRIRLCEREAAWCPAWEDGETVRTEAGVCGYINQALTGSAMLENCGSTVIHFSWKRLFKKDPFDLKRDLVERFYFDNQNGVINPGERKEIPLVFRSNICGVFSESWILVTRPKLCGLEDVVLTLWGIATDPDDNGKQRQSLEQLLDERISKSLANEVVDDLMFSIHSKDTNQIHDRYIQPIGSDLFHKKNNGIYYNSKSVGELLAIADTILSDHGFDRCTVSVEEIRKLIGMMSHEDDVLSEDQNHPTVLEIGQNTMLQKLNSVITELSFSTQQPMVIDKYHICMHLFRNAMDNLSAVGEELKNIYSLKIDTVVENKASLIDESKTSVRKLPGASGKDKKGVAAIKHEGGSKHTTKHGKPHAADKSAIKKAEVTKIETVVILKEDPAIYTKYMDKLNIACQVILADMIKEMDEHLSCMKEKLIF